jgi:hypothetical protein
VSRIEERERKRVKHVGEKKKRGKEGERRTEEGRRMDV